MCVSKLCVGKLCVRELCVSKLCVRELCVSKLRVTQYCKLFLPKQQEHLCTGMIKHNQPTDKKNSTSRGHGARFLSRANEATEIGWMRCWMHHLEPAAVHLDA